MTGKNVSLEIWSQGLQNGISQFTRDLFVEQFSLRSGYPSSITEYHVWNFMFGPAQSDRLAAVGQQAVVDDMVKDLFQRLAEGKVTWKTEWTWKGSFWGLVDWVSQAKFPILLTMLYLILVVQADPIRPTTIYTISSSILLPTQATCQSIKALVGRIARLDHSLVPNLGADKFGAWCDATPNNIIEIENGPNWVERFFLWAFLFLVFLRKEILQLHERFESGGGWGLERTLQTWVSKQPWRWPLPISFFEHLASTCSHSSLCRFNFWHSWKNIVWCHPLIWKA